MDPRVGAGFYQPVGDGIGENSELSSLKGALTSKWEYPLTKNKVSELAARIRQAENEVKVLVEGYPDSEEEHEASATQNGNRDVELNAQDMDLGSDDDGDSDIHSIDALEEKWNELEVRIFVFFLRY
jgi:hypothetical protein